MTLVQALAAGVLPDSLRGLPPLPPCPTIWDHADRAARKVAAWPAWKRRAADTVRVTYTSALKR